MAICWPNAPWRSARLLAYSSWRSTLDGKACQWRPEGVWRRRQRCYLSVTGVRRKSRLELVKKWGNIALHSVFKTDWSRGVTRMAAACGSGAVAEVLE